jgi:hypothetical protein
MIKQNETGYGTNIKVANVSVENGDRGDGGPVVGNDLLWFFSFREKMICTGIIPFSAPSILFDK